MIDKNVNISLHKGFKIKQIEKKDNDGNKHKEELENYRCKISYMQIMIQQITM